MLILQGCAAELRLRDTAAPTASASHSHASSTITVEESTSPILTARHCFGGLVELVSLLRFLRLLLP